jgi:hypothetical protein
VGDLNADESYFDEDGVTTMRREKYTWLITNDFDTTTKSTNATYDRIIVTDGAGTDYAGEAGVFRFDTVYGLNQTMTEDVSDHYPVYAIFWTNADQDRKQRSVENSIPANNKPHFLHLSSSPRYDFLNSDSFSSNSINKRWIICNNPG